MKMFDIQPLRQGTTEVALDELSDEGSLQNLF